MVSGKQYYSLSSLRSSTGYFEMSQTLAAIDKNTNFGILEPIEKSIGSLYKEK